MEENYEFDPRLSNEKRTEDLLEKCDALAEKDGIHFLMVEGRYYPFREVATLIADQLQAHPDKYDAEKLVNWCCRHRGDILKECKEYVDSRMDEIKSRIKNRK